VYDDGSGALAARAWWLLRWMGHEQVTLLEGGLSNWQAMAFAVDAGEVAVAEEQFSGSPRKDRVVETDEILMRAFSIEPLTLLDARDEARYRGEVEPIDKLAGHIPGADNFPFQRSLNSDGTWKTASELQELWKDVLGETQDGPICVMCGSGVTACHLIISALLVGLPEPRLYVGSWSEWIEDPTRPIATGSPEKG
jgi:thiosulfate/3-mercaptopyruvate sulfurtransferase